MRAFVAVWAGQLVSLVGSGLTSFALSVWVYNETGQATPFALTLLFTTLPRILLSPAAGVLGDRYNRRRLLILSDSGSALATLFLALFVLQGTLRVWHVYLITLVSSSFSALQEPVYTASVTLLVPKKQLARAGGMMQAGQSAEMLLSPLLAGALFVAVGLEGIIFIDFATYFFAIATMLVVHIPQPAENDNLEATAVSFWQSFIFGWRYLWNRRNLLMFLLYLALVNFTLSFASALVGPLVLAFETAEALGLVQTIAGAGMLAGSVTMSIWGGPRQRMSGIVGFVVLSSFGLMLVGLRPSVAFIAAGMFVLTFGVPFSAGLSQAIFQTKVAPGVQSRVFAVRSLVARSMTPVAYLAAGPLADNVFRPLLFEGGLLADTLLGRLLGVGPARGIGLMLILVGVVLAVSSTLVLVYPPIRYIEKVLPDAVTA